MSSPLGTRVNIDHICLDCELEISRILLTVDLRVMDMSDFDVILGMDWLTAHRVVIGYDRRRVTTYTQKLDRPKTWCEKCTPMCASARVAPSNIVYLWYGYRSMGIDVLTTGNFFSNVIWIYVMYKKDTSV